MLSALLHKIAAELQGPPQPYRRRPSSAGPERCIRSLVYQANGTESQPFGGRALFIFDDGNWHEELTNNWIRKSAFILHSEQMEVETPVGPGHIDGILTDMLGVDRLYEHKSINHFGFNRIWNGDWPLDYLTQTALYIAGLQKIQPDIDTGVLVLKNKNTAQYIDFTVVYDHLADTLTIMEGERSDGEQIEIGFVMERVTQSAVEKFDTVDAHVAAGTLPDRPFELGTDFPCGYCRFGKLCWESYEAELGELKTDAELPAEIADKVRFYQELGAQLREMGKQRDEVGTDIKHTLVEAAATKGKAGEYIVERRVQKAVSIDASVLPEQWRKAARKETPYERLYIKRIEPEEQTK